MTGEIPPELGGLSNLTGLSRGNQLTGEIPPELGGLSNLTCCTSVTTGLPDVSRRDCGTYLIMTSIS